MRGAERPRVPGRGAGQLCSPACWCRWSWGRSPRCSHHCIRRYLCKPASSAGETITWGFALPAALPLPVPSPGKLLSSGRHSILHPSPECPRGRGRVRWHCTHLLAGPRVVGPHARDGVAPITAGTGLAAEAGSRVDALGAGEAGVGMSALRHGGRERLHPRARQPARQGGRCPGAFRQDPSLAWGCVRRGEASSGSAGAQASLLTRPRRVPTSSMSAQCVPLPSSPGGQGPQRYPGYSYVSMQSTPLKQGLGLQRDRCSWKPEKRRAGQGVRPGGPLPPRVGAEPRRHSPQTWHSMMVLRIRDISFTCEAAEHGASGGGSALAGTLLLGKPSPGRAETAPPPHLVPNIFPQLRQDPVEEGQLGDQRLGLLTCQEQKGQGQPQDRRSLLGPWAGDCSAPPRHRTGRARQPTALPPPPWSRQDPFPCSTSRAL